MGFLGEVRLRDQRQPYRYTSSPFGSAFPVAISWARPGRPDTHWLYETASRRSVRPMLLRLGVVHRVDMSTVCVIRSGQTLGPANWPASTPRAAQLGDHLVLPPRFGPSVKLASRERPHVDKAKSRYERAARMVGDDSRLIVRRQAPQSSRSDFQSTCCCALIGPKTSRPAT